MTSPKQLRVKLRWPPSVNGYWRSVRRGNGVAQIISEDGRAFRSSVALTFQLAGAKVKFHGPVAVEIVLHRADRRRFDVDNYAKAILDGLTHAGVWRDDSQVDELTIRRGAKVEGDAHALVSIRELEAVEV
jgi:crossover junction endodeoxyribonuclease RusA